MSQPYLLVNPLFTNEVVCQVPSHGETKYDIGYRDGSGTIDIYYPESHSGPCAAVIFVTGYPDPGFESIAGMKMKQIPQFSSWAKLFAAHGIAGILYSNEDPVKDVF